jgi:hypothetical protein
LWKGAEGRQIPIESLEALEKELLAIMDDFISVSAQQQKLYQLVLDGIRGKSNLAEIVDLFKRASNSRVEFEVLRWFINIGTEEEYRYACTIIENLRDDILIPDNIEKSLDYRRSMTSSLRTSVGKGESFGCLLPFLLFLPFLSQLNLFGDLGNLFLNAGMFLPPVGRVVKKPVTAQSIAQIIKSRFDGDENQKRIPALREIGIWLGAPGSTVSSHMPQALQLLKQYPGETLQRAVRYRENAVKAISDEIIGIFLQNPDNFVFPKYEILADLFGVNKAIISHYFKKVRASLRSYPDKRFTSRIPKIKTGHTGTKLRWTLGHKEVIRQAVEKITNLYLENPNGFSFPEPIKVAPWFGVTHGAIQAAYWQDILDELLLSHIEALGRMAQFRKFKDGSKERAYLITGEIIERFERNPEFFVFPFEEEAGIWFGVGIHPIHNCWKQVLAEIY